MLADPTHAWWLAIFAVLFVLAAAVMFATFLQYGLTWDEELQSQYGQHVVDWYRSVGADGQALRFNSFEYYGGLFEIPATLATRWLPWGFYENRHFVTVLFALTGVVGAFAAGCAVDSRRTGVVSALFLISIPEYYGHSFNNGKDIPLAAVSAWALAAICWTVRRVPALRARDVMFTGVTLGLVLAVRAGAMFYLFYVVFAWTLAMIRAQRLRAMPARARQREWDRVMTALLMVSLCAWAIMIVLWPFAQVSPLVHPIEAVVQSARFPFNWPVRFMGRDVPATNLPGTYIWIETAIRVPDFLYVALGAGAIAASYTAVKRRVRLTEESIGLGVVALAVLFPLMTAALTRPTLYDGMRDFVFILPPLAVLAAISVSRFVELPIARGVRWTVCGVLAAGLVAVLVEMRQLHPYQSVYFNHVFAGGLAGARGKHETDYWGSSYREATDWVVDNYHPKSARRIVLHNCSTDFLSAYFLNPARDPLLTNGTSADTPDILLATERWNCHQQPSGTLLHTIAREGVPLAYVFEMHGPALLPAFLDPRDSPAAASRPQE